MLNIIPHAINQNDLLSTGGNDNSIIEDDNTTVGMEVEIDGDADEVPKKVCDVIYCESSMVEMFDKLVKLLLTITYNTIHNYNTIKLLVLSIRFNI